MAPRDKGHLRDTPATPKQKSKIWHPGGDPDFRVSPRMCVNCRFYFTSGSDPHVASTYSKKAQQLLYQHNMDLRVVGGLKYITDSPSFIDFKAYDEKEATAKAMLAAAKATADWGTSLPVIFCRLDSETGSGATGETFPKPQDGVTLDAASRYVLIYTNQMSYDSVTLLHEIGHAAGEPGKHPDWELFSLDRRFNIMATPGDLGMDAEKAKDPQYFRNTLYKPTIDLMLKATPWCRPDMESLPTL